MGKYNQNYRGADAYFGAVSRSHKGAANGIVKGWPHLANQLALPIRPGAIGQQNHRDRSVQIDPQRTAAKAQVTNGIRRKK